MILKKIKLENIRSYLNEEIEFPESSVLLSGDVGSGKSSVLLGVDFALFGLTRGILSGGSLLRNGTKEGSVELHLDINGKEVVVKRSLKRNEKSVTQDSGYILVNGEKVESSAVELKAKVLELLKYPKDLLTKSKSLIYRFTVYTPQEEMKKILTEGSEERLEILRRVFDIDKYKRIQENCLIVVRRLKDQIKEGEILIGGLDDKKSEKSNFEKEITENKDKLKGLENELIFFSKQKEDTKLLLDKYEEKINNFRELKNKLILSQNNLEHKQNEKKRIEEEIKNLDTLILNGEELLKGYDNDFEIQTLERLEDVEESIYLKEEKQSRLSEKIGEFNSALKNSEELITNIQELDNCPTCFQLVGDEHKLKITNVETEKLKVSKNNIEIFRGNEEKLTSEIKLLKEELSKLQNSLNEFKIMKIKVEGLNDKRVLREKCEQELSKLLDSFGELNEKTKGLEFEVEENKNLEIEYGSARAKYDSLNDDLKDLEIRNVGLKEKLIGLENNVKRLDDEISHKIKIKERSEGLNSILKWLNDQFLVMMEKMERSVMLRLHHDFDGLFQKWVGILLDNENLSVKLDEEFTPRIVQDGYDTDYDFLSGGEKTAIALAYRLSLNQVINNLMSVIETKDVIILDEPTDGFSNEQLDRVRVVLKELEIKQIIIVSHENKIESFVDKVLRFEKKGHVSNIVKI